MRTCFLHVGTHRTGTTSLQIVLTNYYQELLQRGYLYPITGRLKPGPGHHNIAKELFNSPSFSPENGTVDELINEIRGSNHNVVLSSELFQTVAFRPAGAREFINQLQSCGLTVVVILYLRNQIDYLQSLFFELLKHGLRQPFVEFLQDLLKENVWSWGDLSLTPYYRNLLDALERLSDVEIVVRSYDQVKDARLIPDFFSILGLDACEIGIDSNLRINASNPMVDSVIAFYQNQTGSLIDPAHREIIESFLVELKEKNIHLSMCSSRKVIEQVEASNQRVFSKYSVPQFPRMREPRSENIHDTRLDDTHCLENIFSIDFYRFLLERAGAVSNKTGLAAP